MASENPTQVMSMTKRYGNTVFTVNAFCGEGCSCTFEEKLLELIRNTSAEKAAAVKHDAGSEPAA